MPDSARHAALHRTCEFNLFFFLYSPEQDPQRTGLNAVVTVGILHLSKQLRDKRNTRTLLKHSERLNDTALLKSHFRDTGTMRPLPYRTT